MRGREHGERFGGQAIGFDIPRTAQHGGEPVIARVNGEPSALIRGESLKRRFCGRCRLQGVIAQRKRRIGSVQTIGKVVEIISVRFGGKFDGDLVLLRFPLHGSPIFLNIPTGIERDGDQARDAEITTIKGAKLIAQARSKRAIARALRRIGSLIGRIKRGTRDQVHRIAVLLVLHSDTEEEVHQTIQGDLGGSRRHIATAVYRWRLHLDFRAINIHRLESLRIQHDARTRLEKNVLPSGDAFRPARSGQFGRLRFIGDELLIFCISGRVTGHVNSGEALRLDGEGRVGIGQGAWKIGPDRSLQRQRREDKL